MYKTLRATVVAVAIAYTFSVLYTSNSNLNFTNHMALSSVSRNVVKKVLAVETPEGAGALVRRSIGSTNLRNLSPFLMLDHFHVKQGVCLQYNFFLSLKSTQLCRASLIIRTEANLLSHIC
jgi:hypothetical protein